MNVYPTPLRLVLIEDHPATADALSRYLRGQGHEVHVAADAASARKLVPSVELDILLSDLGLPDGNGWDLLRELSRDRDIKAIAMSGYNSQADRDRSKAAGFIEHLAKPLTPEELESALARAMQGE